MNYATGCTRSNDAGNYYYRLSDFNYVAFDWKDDGNYIDN